MISGTGMLVLDNGREIAAHYQFGGDEDDRRAGYLLCDVSQIDPAALCKRLELVCADGEVIILAVMHSSDKHLGVIGRVTTSGSGATTC